MAINPLVAVLLLWLMKYLIDEVFVGKNVGVLPVVASAYTVLVATKLAIDYLLTRIEAAIAEQIDQNVRVDVYRHLVSVSPGSLAPARALLRDSPILLLDEATASIDSEAEQLIQEAVSRFRGKRTIMVVSHRLSTVLRADRIVVLEGGRIVETSTPTALRGRASRFRALFADQFQTEKVPV